MSIIDMKLPIEVGGGNIRAATKYDEVRESRQWRVEVETVNIAGTIAPTTKIGYLKAKATPRKRKTARKRTYIQLRGPT